MKVRIYQIVPELDCNNLMFRNLQTVTGRSSGKIPEEIYSNVYEGELEANRLEDVFYILNCNQPKDYLSRSLSVSDVVEVIHSPENSSFYFCDSLGFRPFPFDTSRIFSGQEDKI